MRFGRIVLALLLTQVAGAQAPAVSPTPGARIHGVVYDSIARVPLAGAWVQLAAVEGRAASARTVLSDSFGRYAFDDVVEGRYALGFHHALLDSLGIEPRLHSLTVVARRAARVDLAVPSGPTLGAIICRAAAGVDATVMLGGATVVGVVRDARSGAPAADATVSGEWMEISFRAEGTERRRPRLVVSTGANGWFALCNAPIGGTMFLQAARGADSTDMIEAVVPKDGFLRRDLFLGAARVVSAVPSSPVADSIVMAPRLMRVGDGRLRGAVVSAAAGRPLAGAMVRLADGPATRADERGEWTLGGLPAGTRTLEVRAVGYYPLRRVVDVIDGASAVRLALNTFQAVLDTVKIVARYTDDRWDSGFERRQRSAMGRTFTGDDLRKRGVIETSDIFRNVPIVRRAGDLLLMRSAFKFVPGGDADHSCIPSVFLNGMNLFQASASEIDMLVPPAKVRAIEIYDESFVPPQFQQAMSGCGSIVIWTK
ncbi:MAG: carboxypeptidase regulatory-like domain-containing protein [Gemmatimonadota bacterium]|nr:carboxypeptidase regulatory-like domain-containing protein [Gemmatimonadota bacterium]